MTERAIAAASDVGAFGFKSCNFMGISQSYYSLIEHKAKYLQIVFQSEPIECNCKFSHCLSVAPSCTLMLTMPQIHLCLSSSVLIFLIYCSDCQLSAFTLIPHCTYTFNGLFFNLNQVFYMLVHYPY